MLKLERFYCLKCGKKTELLYLPGMSEVTKEKFDQSNEAQLCLVCIEPRPEKRERIKLLH